MGRREGFDRLPCSAATRALASCVSESRTPGVRGRPRLRLSAKGLSHEARAESCKSNGKENGGVAPS